ncbi:hypothetical protein EON80_08190 [bacterium]|nr:MAG: hypothetical protein EON80_08190 [bacterium]
MSLRSAMRKAAGLLIELPPEDENARHDDLNDMPDMEMPLDPSAQTTPRTVEDIVREADGPNLDEIKVEEQEAGSSPRSFVNGNQLDFSAIYQAAKLPLPAFGAEQILEAINGLPADLPLETRRATVRSLLNSLGKSLGATPESVVADASRKLAALNSFAGYMERKTSESVSVFEREIADFESQIEARRAGIEAARSELAKVTRGCESESDKLDDVLEFFSLDVYPSKNTPPAGSEAA